MLTSLISWGLSLIFSGLLVRELAHRVKGIDYRAAGAAAYLGLGAVWAMGLSSSAAMLMATKSAMPPSLFNISGLIPLTQTLFLWQSVATTAILIMVSVLIAYLSTPSPENAKTAESFGVEYEPVHSALEMRSKPGECLEYSPLLTIVVAALLCWYLFDVFRTSPQGALAALLPATPADCKRPVATDTSVTGSPPNGRDPWVERWTFDLCGKQAALDVTFTPSPNGGTDWSATLAK